MDYITIASVVGPTALVTAGAAWGAAKQALNGTRERVTKLEDATVAQQAHNEQMGERTARIETKIDMLINKD
jgi:hypothetical protein